MSPGFARVICCRD